MEALMKERMCKFIFSALLLCASFAGKGQTVDGKLYTIFNNWYQWSGGKFNTNLNIPKVTATTGRDTGGIRYNLADSSMYIWTGSQWRKVGDGGSSLDTSSLSNRINQRVKYTDTAAMLSPYLRSADVTTPTLQQVTTAGNTTTNNITLKDLSTDENRITLTKNVTSAVIQLLAGEGEVGLYNDNNVRRIRLGTTSIRDNDINSIDNIYLPDSSGVLTQRVKVNGTTYNTADNGVIDLGTISSDTTSLSNRINERVKYTDTAAMLSPYLRSNVAAATYQPIGNYDTSTVVKAYVTNAEAVTITKGQVVYIFGASGDRASVKLAKNTSDTFSSKTLGIVRADIAAGQAGWITTQGQVSGINLSAYNPGDILWLDSVAGGFTKVKPVAPKHSVFVGVVERANAGNGLIYVKPQNGQELGELHDTKITSPTNNQVLAYTAATDIWENKSVTTALGYTPLNVTDTTSLSNRINAKVNISDTANMLNPYLRKVDTANFASQDAHVLAGKRFMEIEDHMYRGAAANCPGQLTASKYRLCGTWQGGQENDVNYIVGYQGFTLQYEIGGNTPYLFYIPSSNKLIWSTRVRIPILSAGTQKFYAVIGCLSGTQSTSATNSGMRFLYDLDGTTTGSAASSNWQVCTSTGSPQTRTYTTTNVAVSANTWVKLRIVISNSEALYYIDDVLVATHTTNITGVNIFPAHTMNYISGASDRVMHFDYSTLQINYNTPR